MIHLVASGYRISEVSRRTGVARRTIYNWIERDLDFNGRLAEEIFERRDSMRQAASATWHVAADVLRDILESGTTAEKLAAASLALKYAGAVLGAGEPANETSALTPGSSDRAIVHATELTGRRLFASHARKGTGRRAQAATRKPVRGPSIVSPLA